MNCDANIHNGLKEEGEIICPFCDERLIDVLNKKDDEPCCDNKETINENGMIVCINCGVVDGYKYVSEYINFYENVCKFKKKSVYHRKYHIKNILDDICFKHRIQISYNYRIQINSLFKKIGGVLLNDKRKRSIKFSFIFRKLFELLQSPYHKYFKLPKSNKTLVQYNAIWKNICEECSLIYIKSEKVDDDPFQKVMSSIYSKHIKLAKNTNDIDYKYNKLMSNL